MDLDSRTVEQLIEIITREVLVAMAEQHSPAAMQAGQHCQFDCAEGVCVHTCFDQAGHVINAGAERLSSTIGVIPDTNLAPLIDHTLLKPDATPEQITQLCSEARKYGFASVCINPSLGQPVRQTAAGLAGKGLLRSSAFPWAPPPPR